MKPRKTKSGKWRCQLYLGDEYIDGKRKQIIKSFTASTKSDAEMMAYEYKRTHGTRSVADLTVSDAMKRYIEAKSNVLSETTLKAYESQREHYYGMIKDVRIRDLILAQGACTNSRMAHHFRLPGTFAPIASWELLTEAVKAAQAHGATYHVGNVNSSDVFYGDHKDVPEGLDSVYGLKKMGVMALEMEAAALYMNAARYGKRGLCICTISDHVLKGVETTAEERQNSFTTMMKVALDVAVAMENK